MFDVSAFDAGGFDPLPRDQGLPQRESFDDKADSSDASIALAGCAACQQAIGDCAFHYAKSGVISPALAMSICGSMQRMALRAVKLRSATVSSYFAYVLLGPGRDQASRSMNLELLAETMR